MKQLRVVPIIAAAVLVSLAAALPGGAAELGRPTVYCDGWGGAYAGLFSDPARTEERGLAAGMAAGAYSDLGRKVSGAIRANYWEAWDDRTFSRRYTALDALLGPRFGAVRLLGGLTILDRRDFFGEQWGGWGWRLGVAGETIIRRVLVGGGLYATPHLRLQHWWGGLELGPGDANALEKEFYLVIPLGGAWAVRGGYRSFRLAVKEAGGWWREEAEVLFLGASARF
ncbi:MAG: hypothetical protein ACM3XZ_06805 [Betaproteobacteria bacterium]